MNHDIRLLTTTDDLRAAFPVMVQLRTHLDEHTFITQAKRQFSTGYHLAGCSRDENLLSLAGYRYGENLFAGRYMYVDDLVTDEAARGSGSGKALFAWLVSEARHNGCAQLHLDSGVQRHAAHRFYLDRGMIINSHHFRLEL